MADIKGDEITIVACARIDKAIEQVGSTSSIDHVGKGLQYGSAGVELADANTKPDKFAGVVKAVGADAEPEFQSTRVIDNFVAGRNSTDMPYFHGSVSVPKGVDVTVPTKTSDLTNDSDFMTVSYDSTNERIVFA